MLFRSLRRIEQISGSAVGNILDLTGVSRVPKVGKAQRLSLERIKEVFGTTTPTRQQVNDGMERLEHSISRGAAVCFPIYEDGKPVDWFFAGYSSD